MEARPNRYMPRQYRRKLLFPPGWMSLVTLPVLLLSYTQQHHVFQELRAMEVVWPLKSSKDYTVPVFSFDQLPQRQYQRILLTGNEAEDKVRIAYARLAMRRILANQDTVAGIQIHFGPQAKYGSFVRILDLCQIENIRTYMPYQDDVWIYHMPPPKLTELQVCGTLVRMRHLKSPSQLEHERQARIDFWMTAIKDLWLPLLLFVILLGSAFRVVRQLVHA